MSKRLPETADFQQIFSRIWQYLIEYLRQPHLLLQINATFGDVNDFLIFLLVSDLQKSIQILSLAQANVVAILSVILIEGKLYKPNQVNFR